MSTQTSPRAKVLVVHGLGHVVFFSHRRMMRRLREAGYAARFLRYPSTRHSIGELAERYLAPALRELRAKEPVEAPVHVVTFSMGALLLRAFLAANAFDQLGRVVMVAPPNGGSHWVDHFGRFGLFRRVYGPSGAEMDTRPDSLPRRLPPAAYECGIIAGRLPVHQLVQPFFRGEPSDGTVAVSCTHLEGAADHRTVSGLHALLLSSPRTIELTLGFLETGRFPASAGQGAAQSVSGRATSSTVGSSTSA
jgi:hypothetical protein